MRIVEAVKHHYQKENLDFLVNVLVEGSENVNMKWMTGVLDVMTKQKSGLVLNILGEKTSGEESMVSTSLWIDGVLSLACFNCIG